ncbi:hypothetical protein Hanom_Chr16g01435311 [Helianthus anomalus]
MQLKSIRVLSDISRFRTYSSDGFMNFFQGFLVVVFYYPFFSKLYTVSIIYFQTEEIPENL